MSGERLRTPVQPLELLNNRGYQQIRASQEYDLDPLSNRRVLVLEYWHEQEMEAENSAPSGWRALAMMDEAEAIHLARWILWYFYSTKEGE